MIFPAKKASILLSGGDLKILSIAATDLASAFVDELASSTEDFGPLLEARLEGVLRPVCGLFGEALEVGKVVKVVGRGRSEFVFPALSVSFPTRGAEVLISLQRRRSDSRVEEFDWSPDGTVFTETIGGGGWFLVEPRR